MSHALLAIRNILQNSNIFILSRETVLFTPFGEKKVTQLSGFSPTSVSYHKYKYIFSFSFFLSFSIFFSFSSDIVTGLNVSEFNQMYEILG